MRGISLVGSLLRLDSSGQDRRRIAGDYRFKSQCGQNVDYKNKSQKDRFSMLFCMVACR